MCAADDQQATVRVAEAIHQHTCMRHVACAWEPVLRQPLQSLGLLNLCNNLDTLLGKPSQLSTALPLLLSVHNQPACWLLTDLHGLLHRGQLAGWQLGGDVSCTSTAARQQRILLVEIASTWRDAMAQVCMKHLSASLKDSHCTQAANLVRQCSDAKQRQQCMEVPGKPSRGPWGSRGCTSCLLTSVTHGTSCLGGGERSGRC